MNLRIFTIQFLWSVISITIISSMSQPGFAQSGKDADKLEFFENRIRPVLIEHCYKCHNSSDRTDADLALDYRDGIREEAETGIAVVPGQPDKSLLLKVIRHEIKGRKMPKDGGRLSPEVVRDFEKWIRDGAVDPRDNPPSAQELAKAVSWETILEKRKKWWSFQPVVKPELPAENKWSNHPVDRFVFQALQKNDLKPNEPASKRVLLRRLNFALTGLPPSSVDVEAFVTDRKPKAFEYRVDRLLASPRFGERWARHWMDLVRYADSHGSEGDPAIPNAYQYRDYLIRAFNQDVPYDQLLKEHVAGDLLPKPRLNKELGINESAIGTAHWRFVFHGFAPTDALDEKVRFTDDQINVFGKAFLGLTISCARCHDHKFDAISQKDYYALFGILGSCPPMMQDVGNANDEETVEKLKATKKKIKKVLVANWFEQLDEIEAGLGEPGVDFFKSLFSEFPGAEDSQKFTAAQMKQFKKTITNRQKQAREFLESGIKTSWSLGDDDDFAKWYYDYQFGQRQPDQAGSFSVDSTRDKGGDKIDRIVSAIYPTGLNTNQLTARNRAVLMSPKIHLDGEYEAWLLVRGGGQASIRYVVQDYPRNGTVYPINQLNSKDWYWHRLDLKYWQGDDVHLEITTSKDAPIVVGNSDESWFGIRYALVRRKEGKQPPSLDYEALVPLLSSDFFKQAENSKELAAQFRLVIEKCVNSWAKDEISDAEACLLNLCVRENLLSTTVKSLPTLAPLVSEFRRLRASLASPVRAPGVAEAYPSDQPLLIRGDHRRPGEPVPRRFLEAIDSKPYKTAGSGRLELANDLVRADNPLTARVIVNRIWHYLIGKGLVSTPDNFGQLGDQPSHPELLDYLAARMVENNWSIKETIRFILTSKTWQLDSRQSPKSTEMDPENRWLSHANVRRLDAEAIRDSLLAVSGELDKTMYGPGINANDRNNRRRSIYVLSRRNSLDQFLQQFDSPVPFATTGRRAQTNVPAQSLTMLNDPLVGNLAERWGKTASNDSADLSRRKIIDRMFVSALSRPATPVELNLFESYLAEIEIVNETDKVMRQEMTRDIDRQKKLFAAILDPVRNRLLSQIKKNEQSEIGPAPFARWDFGVGIDDTITGLKGKLHGDAKFDKALVVGGSGHLATEPIQKAVAARTLEVWVQLSDLQQRGGGVMTIQDLQGNVFDSIVFGEQVPGHWLAGSNGFARTQSFGGPQETESDSSPVHFAIAYDADGTIRGYRDGKPYGKPYRKAPIHTYAAGQCQVVFGLRHGQPGGNRMLNGKISEARLYDRALSAEEISASATRSGFVSRTQILNELTKSQRVTVKKLEMYIETLETVLEKMGKPTHDSDKWGRAAHAIFNLKEFIYVQ